MQQTENNVSQEVSIYVGNLHKDIGDREIYELFKDYGNIAGVNVCRNAYTKESMGYGYVNFKSKEEATKAMDKLNCHLVKDKPIRIMWVDKDPSSRRSGKGNIIIRNLDKGITDRDLYETFIQLGEIMSCKVSRDYTTHESKGYGYVQFKEEKDAQTAIEQVNGKEIMGLKVKVDTFIPKRERENIRKNSWTNCYVKELPSSIQSDESLAKLFSPYGKISSPKLRIDPNTNQSTGAGFVDFEEHESAVKAQQALHETQIEDKTLIVARFQPKSERQAALRKRYEQRRKENQRLYQGKNLYIKNLSDDISAEDLMENFKEFGTISSCVVMKDERGLTKGFGFVCYENKEDADRAMEKMRNSKLPGSDKNLFVALHEPKEERRKRMQEKKRQNFRYQYPVYPNYGRMPPAAMQPIPYAYPPRQPKPSIPTLNEIITMNPEEQTTVLGELLFQKVHQMQPEHATKITGMFLKANWPLPQKYSLLSDDNMLSEAINSAMKLLSGGN